MSVQAIEIAQVAKPVAQTDQARKPSINSIVATGSSASKVPTTKGPASSIYAPQISKTTPTSAPSTTAGLPKRKGSSDDTAVQDPTIRSDQSANNPDSTEMWQLAFEITSQMTPDLSQTQQADSTGANHEDTLGERKTSSQPQSFSRKQRAGIQWLALLSLHLLLRRTDRHDQQCVRG
jgi:hypothetical protein